MIGILNGQILLDRPIKRDEVPVPKDLVAVEKHLGQIHPVDAPGVADYKS